MNRIDRTKEDERVLKEFFEFVFEKDSWLYRQVQKIRKALKKLVEGYLKQMEMRPYYEWSAY